VNEWLLSAGWTLVDAGTTFGVVKTSVVENWPRIASKRVQGAIDQTRQGTFDFSRLENLLTDDAKNASDDGGEDLED
jgi:hypothetical protein